MVSVEACNGAGASDPSRVTFHLSNPAKRAIGLKVFQARVVQRAFVLLICAPGLYCAEGTSSKSGQLAPTSVQVRENPNNVLSAIVAVELSDAVMVRAQYSSAAGDDSGSTPDFDVNTNNMDLPVLGLLPQTDYFIQVVATESDGTLVQGAPIHFRTGYLPANVPSFVALQAGDLQPGFTMVGWIAIGSARNPAVIVDQTGRVVWYRDNPAVISDWQKQPDGTYTAAVNNAVTQYHQFDDLGNLLRTWSAIGDWRTDNHELRILPDGSALIMAFDQKSMDLTSLGGQANATVVGNVIQRLSPSGTVEFQWDAFDHLSIEAIDPLVDLSGANVDWTHANSIDVMSDGNYLVSVRHLSQVLKIDSQTGAILWKLGGLDGNFQFVNDPSNGFSLQHGARELPDGNILLFDNGSRQVPPQSRAVEYQLDSVNLVAMMVWQYRAPAAFYASAMGFAQRLNNGNTLIAYGTAQPPRVQEVTPAGEVIWDLVSMTPGFGIYRAFRIESLY